MTEANATGTTIQRVPLDRGTGTPGHALAGLHAASPGSD